jgi:hypothetical protein
MARTLTTAHWCPVHAPATGAGIGPGLFCGAPHPDRAAVSCRRIDGHDGEHAAFVFSVITPETW